MVDEPMETSEQLEKKYKGMKTTELMDELDTAEDYVEEAWAAFEKRDTIQYLIEMISGLDERVKGQQIAIDKLKRHKHLEGELVVEL